MADINPGERVQIGRLIRAERERRCWTKRDAYGRAPLNSATWDRIEAGATVREDRLRTAVITLWPHTGGDWRTVLATPQQVAALPHPLDLRTVPTDLLIAEISRRIHENYPTQNT